MGYIDYTELVVRSDSIQWLAKLYKSLDESFATKNFCEKETSYCIDEETGWTKEVNENYETGDMTHSYYGTFDLDQQKYDMLINFECEYSFWTGVYGCNADFEISSSALSSEFIERDSLAFKTSMDKQGDATSALKAVQSSVEEFTGYKLPMSLKVEF